MLFFSIFYPKVCSIKGCKCHNFLHWWIVRSQIWDRTVHRLFETALFTDCKSYIIFLFRGTRLLFFLYFFFLFFMAFFRLSFLFSNHISFSFLRSPAPTTENHGGSGLAKPWRRWGRVCGLWVSAVDRVGWVAVVQRAWLCFDRCVGFRWVLWFDFGWEISKICSF